MSIFFIKPRLIICFYYTFLFKIYRFFLRFQGKKRIIITWLRNKSIIRFSSLFEQKADAAYNI